MKTAKTITIQRTTRRTRVPTKGMVASFSAQKIIGGVSVLAKTKAVRVIHVGGLAVEVVQVPVASARNDMPTLMRASAEQGQAYLIHNAKNASAATALLINPDVLGNLMTVKAAPRTLGELINTLPFKRRGAPRLEVNMVDDDAPLLNLPQPSAKTRSRVRTRAAKTS